MQIPAGRTTAIARRIPVLGKPHHHEMFIMFATSESYLPISKHINMAIINLGKIVNNNNSGLTISGEQQQSQPTEKSSLSNIRYGLLLKRTALL